MNNAKNSENNNIYHVKHTKSDLARYQISKNAGIFDFKKIKQISRSKKRSEIEIRVRFDLIIDFPK